MNEVLPQALLSSKQPRPLASSIRGGMVVSTSGSQGASGRISLQVALNKPVCLLPNQWYLKFDLAVTGTNDNFIFFNGSRDASSLIRKITITVGGVVVETIDYYHNLVAHMETHTASQGFRNCDLRILSRASNVDAGNNALHAIGGAVVAGGTVSEANLVVPIMSGFLNAQSGIPAYLLNAPMVIDIELNSIAGALLAVTNASPPLAGTAPTAFTISDARLHYLEAVLDDAFVQRVKADMAQNQQMYQIFHSTWFNNQQAASASSSLIYGLNYASLNGVFWTTHAAESAVAQKAFKSGADGAAAFPFANSYTLAQAVTNQPSRFDILLDGRRLLQHDTASSVECYCNLQRGLGILWDSQYSSSTLTGNSDQNNKPYMGRGEYGGQHFWAGQSCRRFLDSDLAFEGSACQTAQVDIARTHTAGDLLTVYFNYDQVVSIDVNGMVSVNK
jgi:hypothetical protein